VEPFISRDEMITLLSDLVHIYSPYFREEGAVEYAYAWLKKNNLPAELHHFSEDKITHFRGANVIGRLSGDKDGPTVLLNGHLDTVEICDGWTKDPLGAELIGDRMYGVGVLDMKAGCAAILLALRAFARNTKRFCGSVVYTLVSDEEGPYGLGTDALIRDGLTDGIDVAIVLEPSSAFTDSAFPTLCLGARGGWKYTVTVKGKASHGATPEKGINAVSEAAKIVLEIEKNELCGHERLGPGSICVLEFHGGGYPLSVPDVASFSVFRHTTLGETKDDIKREVEKAIARAEIKAEAFMAFREAPNEGCDGFEAYIVPTDDPYAVSFKESAFSVTGKPVSISYFNSLGDFNYLASRAKLPTLIFGPSGSNYHSPDEYVEVESALQTANILYHFLCSVLCGQEERTKRERRG